MKLTKEELLAFAYETMAEVNRKIDLCDMAWILGGTICYGIGR